MNNLYLLERKPGMKFFSLQSCAENWEAMEGDSRKRLCTACDKQVHNFVGLKLEEIEALVSREGGDVCARFVRPAWESVKTLEEHSEQRLAAGLLFTDAETETAAAPQLTEPVESGMAQVTGTVVERAAFAPQAGLGVSLVLKDRTVAETNTDEQGRFRLKSAPGRYDIVILKDAALKFWIGSGYLRERDQSLVSLRMSDLPPEPQEYAIMGQVQVPGRFILTRLLFKELVRSVKKRLHLP